MKIFIALILILAGCRSQYDTSKAIDILPTDEITIDYRLKDLPFQIDDETFVASILQNKKKKLLILPILYNLLSISEAIFFLRQIRKSQLSLLEIRTTKPKKFPQNIKFQTQCLLQMVILF